MYADSARQEEEGPGTGEDPLTEGLRMLSQSSAQALVVEIWIKQSKSHSEPVSEDCPCAYAQLHLTNKRAHLLVDASL